ncbi:MAG: hypothetical protein ABI831_27735, partial [Betaproteobacteria bacterium]
MKQKITLDFNPVIHQEENMVPAHDGLAEPAAPKADLRHADALLTAGALQRAIFNSANFSSIATD